MVLRFRHLDITPDDPIEVWGVEGLLAAIDRGSLTHWRAIARHVAAQPYGRVAEDLQVALGLAESRGAVALLTRALCSARQ